MQSQTGITDAITPAQIRAARALLDWSREELAVQSGAPMRTLARLETGESEPRRQSLEKIRRTLEAAGIEFLPDNGVRLGSRMS